MVRQGCWTGETEISNELVAGDRYYIVLFARRKRKTKALTEPLTAKASGGRSRFFQGFSGGRGSLAGSPIGVAIVEGVEESWIKETVSRSVNSEVSGVVGETMQGDEKEETR